MGEYSLFCLFEFQYELIGYIQVAHKIEIVVAVVKSGTGIRRIKGIESLLWTYVQAVCKQGNDAPYLVP